MLFIINDQKPVRSQVDRLCRSSNNVRIFSVGILRVHWQVRKYRDRSKPASDSRSVVLVEGRIAILSDCLILSDSLNLDLLRTQKCVSLNSLSLWNTGHIPLPLSANRLPMGGWTWSIGSPPRIGIKSTSSAAPFAVTPPMPIHPSRSCGNSVGPTGRYGVLLYRGALRLSYCGSVCPRAFLCRFAYPPDFATSLQPNNRNEQRMSEVPRCIVRCVLS